MQQSAVAAVPQSRGQLTAMMKRLSRWSKNYESDSNSCSLSTLMHTSSTKLFPSGIKLLYETDSCVLECVAFSPTPWSRNKNTGTY